MSEDDDRTSPIGLFNYAHSYWRSAAKLRRTKVRATHADPPVLFLYCHAIELYLKAYLRGGGLSVSALKKVGHNMRKLAGMAEAMGLHFDDEDTEVIGVIHAMDIFTLRYIRRGPFVWPHPEALERTCKSFHDSVGRDLKTKGHPVRLNPIWRAPAASAPIKGGRRA